MITFFVIALVLVKKKSSLDNFINKTFFKRPTKTLLLRRLFFITGVGLLLISLLDPRGPEERIESSIPDQKTIIIIDSSASMLAEDVRPNRFKKSILMARHFIKKAFGHKIAVVLFSDTQKRLVPFTDDLDLLDARVAGLEDLDIYDGGSNISQAIKESLSYFLVDGGKLDDVGGNILLFTDSEGHDEAFKLKLPDQVTVAAVGVGTAKGARIPNRDRFGVFRGYKKFKSDEVVTKLNEDWLKELGDNVKTYKYWVANSYTIPTEDILAFFNKSFSSKIKKGMATVRPVKVATFLIPAIIFLSLGYLLYLFPSYGLALFVIALIPLRGQHLEASELQSQAIEQLREKLKNGELNKEGKLKFAEILLKSKEAEAAKVLYEENLDQASPAHKNNYAISLIQNKKPEQAIKVLSELQKEIRNGIVTATDTERGEIRQNMLLALQAQQKQSQQKQKSKKSEDEKNKKKKKGEGQEGDSKGKKKEGKQGEGEEKKSKDQESKDKNKKQKQDEEKGKEKQKAQTLKEKQDQIRKKRKMVKVPGLIKQIMSDDRALQKKYLDTSTKKPKVYQKKDW
jgi:Ca-activated chloride channel family protein